ncbi:MAG: hypothetical protein K6C10_11370 [Prevotella sp.]|nr:hypothetical protein [Prevotella sp.]
MKRIVLLMSVFFSLCAMAQNDAKVGTVTLGLPYDQAVTAIKAEFGEPVSASADELVYSKKTFEGYTYDEVKFRFKNGKFNEARFFAKVGAKGAAQRKMEEVAKKMGQRYNLSRDIEEGNTWFYKGGRAPVGVSHLFTICTYPKQGSHGVELRYGPIRF